jgi:hypothetical protein
MAQIINKTFRANTKDVNYVNRDFASLKQQLIDFTKQYYPQSYRDFSESSPGQIFIEQAAYVGDILSYYTDQQFKESFIQFATDRRNLINQARYLGYKPKVTSAAATDLELFQLVPAKRVGEIDGEYVPDDTYCLILKPFTELSSVSGVPFLIEESVDFSQDTVFSPREVSVYNRDETGAPLFYLIKKTAKAYAGKLVVKQVSVGTATPFLEIKLDATDVLKVASIVDSNNNNYYEVQYLAQETIPISVDNVPLTNQTLSKYRGETPKLLKYLRTENRFITTIDENNSTYIQFGANTENFDNTVIIPNPSNVGVGLSNLDNLNISLDGTNVLKSNSYGVSPSNTILTITYIVGGGVNSNVNSGEINTISAVGLMNDITGLTDSQVTLFNNIKNSLRVNNPLAATGGDGPETDEEIRQNAIANFSSQNRIVTEEDILLRVYAMSPQFGSIAKAFVQSNATRQIAYTGLISGVITGSAAQNELLNLNPLNPLDRRKFLESNNPFTNNLYILGYNSDKKLTPCNEATLLNLKNYLSQYKILTDRFNVIDGYIINIGVEFKITVFAGFNKRDVLNECIASVQAFFNIDNWGFNQPINLSQLTFEIMKNEGVQSVTEVTIKNLTYDTDGVQYSPIAYNIDIATQNNIVYPSKDPSIFEVKFPDTDIKGLVV